MSNPQVELHISGYGVVTLELDGDKRQFHLLKSRAWYASRPDLLGKSAAAR